MKIKSHWNVYCRVQFVGCCRWFEKGVILIHQSCIPADSQTLAIAAAINAQTGVECGDFEFDFFEGRWQSNPDECERCFDEDEFFVLDDISHDELNLIVEPVGEDVLMRLHHAPTLLPIH